MEDPLTTFLETQGEKRRADAEFASRLHPKRTAFLADLIAPLPHLAAYARLRAPWLDIARLRERVRAACVWLDGVAIRDGVKGWEGHSLVFLQSGSERWDAHEHLKRCDSPHGKFYAAAFRHLPPAVHYLHIHTNVRNKLLGRWDKGDLRLLPLGAVFSTYQPPVVYDDARRRPHLVKAHAIGYRMSKLPWVLGVSPEVATDYFARIVVHDLCHGFLPDTPRKAEGFHNVSALAAMGDLPPPTYRSAWERFIHAECTDPTFCLRADREIVEVRRALGIPSLVQEDILEAYRKWYVHPQASVNRRAHWGLADEDPASLLRKIDEARADGFRLNVRLMNKS